MIEKACGSASIRPALFTPSYKFASLQTELNGEQLRPSFPPLVQVYHQSSVDYGFQVKFISDDDRRSGLHDL